jgi:hypothetical protein
MANVIRWLGVIPESGVGMNLFDPGNTAVMIDDGHLEACGWERAITAEDRARPMKKSIADFRPSEGLDRFGFTGRRLAGKIILFNFERTHPGIWKEFAPWFDALKAEIIARVNAVDSDASPLFGLYDWSDHGVATAGVDARFVPMNKARKDPTAWLVRNHAWLKQPGVYPLLQPTNPPSASDVLFSEATGADEIQAVWTECVERAILLLLPYSDTLFLWGVTSVAEYAAVNARFVEIESRWHRMHAARK